MTALLLWDVYGNIGVNKKLVTGNPEHRIIRRKEICNPAREAAGPPGFLVIGIVNGEKDRHSS